MTDMIYVEPEMIPPSGPLQSGFDCGWYYWSSNKHASFIVWRIKDHREFGIRATIRYQEDGTYAYTITAPEWLKPRPITGTEQGLAAAKIAVNGHLGRIIEAVFREESLPPLG